MKILKSVGSAVASPFVRSSASKKRKRYLATKTRLTTAQLKRGDILIAQETDSAFASEFDANFVRAGQAMFSHFGHNTTASATSEHVVLGLGNGTEDGVEAVELGVITSRYLSPRRHLVYRYNGSIGALANWAAVVGETFAVNSVGTKKGDQTVSYAGIGKTAASVFRSKRVGRSAKKRVQRVHDIWREMINGTRSQADLRKEGLGMICSEFAATCYEVAALALADTTVLNVDPRAMTAKALEATLNQNGSFSCVGLYTGQVGADTNSYPSQLVHPAVNEMIRAEIGAGNSIEDHETEAEDNWVDVTVDLRDPFRLQHSHLQSIDWGKLPLKSLRYAPAHGAQLGKYVVNFEAKGFNCESILRAPKSNGAVVG